MKFLKMIKDKFSRFSSLLRKAIYFAWYRHHFLIPPRVLANYIKSFMNSMKRSNTFSDFFVSQSAYLNWLSENDKSIEYEQFSYNPKFSFIIPTYNVSKELLSECLDSILCQSYRNFEICIADDCSSNVETIKTLKEYEKNDAIKIIYRKENGMISKASNSALSLATGEFIVLVDNDDTIHKDALYYFAKALNNDKKIDFLYTDEDRIDINGKYCIPHFKPDFSPETIMSINYICHLSCIRKSLIDKIGGFRSEYDGSQDYDLFLRILDYTKNVYHVEKILYHWRESITSTALVNDSKPYTHLAGKKALEDTLKRRNIKGEIVESERFPSAFITKYEHNNPLVSIIIPIRDQAKLTRKCLESLYNKMNYKNFEIILIDNGSKEIDTFKLFEEYKKKDNFKVIRIDKEFNYAYLNNEGAKEAKGEYLLLLNNDTEVIDNDFLDYMVGYGQQEHVGCVGLKLLYPDKSVQHAGIVLGLGGLAGHVYSTAKYEDNGIFGRLAIPYNYMAVTAACLLISKKKFNEVNGFDENLKVSANDVDLNLKILDKGYYNVCLSNIEMWHYESKSRKYASSSEKQKQFQFEQQYMREKWKEKLIDRFYSKNYF